MDMGSSHGPMGVLMKGSSSKTIFMDSALTTGLMDGDITGTGRTTRWTAKEHSLGAMDACIEVNTSMTRNKDSGCSCGQTDGDMKAGGSTGNSTAKACISLHRAHAGKGSGKKGKESSGQHLKAITRKLVILDEYADSLRLIHLSSKID